MTQWLNDRFPAKEIWDEHAAQYYVPKSLNFWYYFGVFSTLVLVNQIITGIWLCMFYDPSAMDAFASVESIMRDVKLGWLIRYMHSTGASAFFIVVYLHMYRGIMYGSFKAPRELVWLIGMCLFVLLILESGSGYVLPWGQMSYWATKVLVEIYTVIPFIGKYIVTWVMGDYNISGVTLHRFFALHVAAFPLVIIAFFVIHIMALHHVGSNNPDGIPIKKKKSASSRHPVDTIPFHPYYTVKDFAGVIAFLIVFFAVVFFFPTMGGYFLEPTNFIQANPLVTPHHIAPPWYLAPLYAILRAVPNKLLGVLCVALAVAFLFVLPWLDRSPIRSMRYRGMGTMVGLIVLVVSYVALGFLGLVALSNTAIWFSRIFTILYFLYFITLPFVSKYEKTKPLPKRVRFK